MKKQHLILAVLTAAMVWPASCFAQTVTISNGVVGEGALSVMVDTYGAYGNFNPAYVDAFQPLGSVSNSPTFSAGIRYFSGADKVLLTDMAQWEGAIPANDPETLVTNISMPVFNVDSSTASSAFTVCTPAGAPLVDFVVTQTASAGVAAGVAILDQTYEITNVSGSDMDFSLNRVLDADLVWDGDFLSDHVAINNALNVVGQHEPGNGAQAMALTSGVTGVPADSYWGAKNTHLPTGGAPAMGFGTDFIQWGQSPPGLPTSWENYIAFSGTNVASGDSGFDLNDGHVGLNWDLSLLDGASTTISVRTIYGAYCILGDVNGDGAVTLLDVLPFVGAISAGTFLCEADVNRDGVVDLLDVAGFVAILGG